LKNNNGLTTDEHFAVSQLNVHEARPPRCLKRLHPGLPNLSDQYFATNVCEPPVTGSSFAPLKAKNTASESRIRRCPKAL
jgi:hypothetical protein